MKKVLLILLSVLIIMSAFAGCSKAKEPDFKPTAEGGDIGVVSFNVAGPWGNVLNGTGAGARVKRFAVYMNAVKPDIIGTQEMNSTWMDKLATLMPDYDSYGVQRGGDDNEKKSEMNSVFWLKDKYECVEKNTFWLSETPDTVSRYEGAGCNRVCSYVMLRDKETDKYILAANTHLDNASDEAREFGARVIIDKLFEIKTISAFAVDTVVLTGDFNECLGDAGTSILESEYNVMAVDGNTYHDWGNITDDGPIDFIFTSGEIVSAQRLDDTTNGFVSDHYGVYERINLS